MGHFDFPQSVYNLWCYESLSKLLIPPLLHPFKNNDGIEKAGMMANHLKYHSIYSVERIRQPHLTHSILEFCKRLEPNANLALT